MGAKKQIESRTIKNDSKCDMFEKYCEGRTSRYPDEPSATHSNDDSFNFNNMGEEPIGESSKTEEMSESSQPQKPNGVPSMQDMFRRESVARELQRLRMVDGVTQEYMRTEMEAEMKSMRKAS